MCGPFLRGIYTPDPALMLENFNIPKSNGASAIISPTTLSHLFKMPPPPPAPELDCLDPHCAYQTSNKGNFTTNLRNHSPGWPDFIKPDHPYSKDCCFCIECEMNLASVGDLMRHIDEHHEPALENYPKAFTPGVARLWPYIINYGAGEGGSCSQCEKSFSSDRDLSNHLKEWHRLKFEDFLERGKAEALANLPHYIKQGHTVGDCKCSARWYCLECKDVFSV